MNSLAALAEFVQSRDLAALPEARHDRLKRHVIDTLGALQAGCRLEEGVSMGELAARDGSRHAAIVAACAAARSTEIDDIHLSSCTTPGSVVIPVAFALAAAHELRTWGEFCAAVAAGYEMLIRLGYAIDGPAILRKKVWPTYFAAAFGAAAVASRAYHLSVNQTSGALATALTFAAGTSAPARCSDSSRWLSLGAAAANGVLGATGARMGLMGASDLLERYAGRIAGVAISRKRLADHLGETWLFDQIGMKPYPIARQALAAVEAVREIIASEGLRPQTIEEIVVSVPEAQRWVIDHPEPVASRMDSIVSVQYQIALALLAPERLLDIRRTPPLLSLPVRSMMAKVRVRRAPDLEKYTPEAWPAKVEIRAGGRRRRHQVLHPRGDAKNPLSWDEVSSKFTALGGTEAVVRQLRNLDAGDAMPQLWEAHA
ncbi:MAG TPA: MmgE/PrpD family protein [Bryobacteraceae bacterium]|nr:MmgE/PrpD family protein [Bryobacteraceae bacterium]